MENQLPCDGNLLERYSGILGLIILLGLYGLWKKCYAACEKKLTMLCLKYTSPILTCKDVVKKSVSKADHIRIRHFGDIYLVVRSSRLACGILAHPDKFENRSFLSRSFNLCSNLLGVTLKTNAVKNVLASLGEKPSDCDDIRLRQLLQEGNGDDKIEKNSTEYEIYTNEAFKQTNVAFTKKKTYSGELYPSLATNESSDTEKTRSQETFCYSKPVKFTSKMDRNMELLLSEERFQKNEKQTLKECCYSVLKTQQPFILMKQTDDKRISNFRVMNSQSGLIRKKSTTNAQPSYPSIESCIKELIVLLEAQANRKRTVNIKKFSLAHAVNILGVCVFGKTVNQLTSSNCQFYSVCQQLHEIFKNNEKPKTIRYVNSWLEAVGIKKQNGKPDLVTGYFKNAVDAFCLRHESEQNCLLSYLINNSTDRGSNVDKTEITETITAFLIAFCINVLEVLGGSLSLLLYELSKNIELQEKLRINDKVEFNLEGFPRLDCKKNAQLTLTESFIKEVSQTWPIDPVIELICKRTYNIPDTKFRITPESKVLLPLHVLKNETDGNKKSSTEDPYAVVSDGEIQFNSFVKEFVKTCLKTSLASLLQQYEFKVRQPQSQLDECITSCRFSTLPDELCLSLSRVEKRGKIVIFQESLRAFHALQNASSFWSFFFDRSCSAFLSH